MYFDRATVSLALNPTNGMAKKLACFLGCLFLVWQSLVAQPVKDLNQTAKSNSGRSGGGNSSGSSFDGGGDIGTAFFLIESFIYAGQAIVVLAKEEVRLFRRNKEENDLFGLEANVQGGYGMSDFTRLQAQGRLHLGWLSLDVKQTMLNDPTTEFRTLDMMAWFNILNLPKAKWRLGTGGLSFQNTGDSYFRYGMGLEFIPYRRFRIEASGGLTQKFASEPVRPFSELQLHVLYDIWQKGFGRASLKAGCTHQTFFNQHRFTTADIGARFFLSFARFQEKIGTR
jgi:hypothetical protein